MSKIIGAAVGAIVLAMAAPTPISAQNGHGKGIVCTPAEELGVEPGNPGEVIQDLRDTLPGNLTPPEIADLAGYDSVGDAITTDCATPGRPKGNND
jgi:hypothetical protein